MRPTVALPLLNTEKINFTLIFEAQTRQDRNCAQAETFQNLVTHVSNLRVLYLLSR
jgi:hypothetical protein